MGSSTGAWPGRVLRGVLTAAGIWLPLYALMSLVTNTWHRYPPYRVEPRDVALTLVWIAATGIGLSLMMQRPWTLKRIAIGLGIAAAMAGAFWVSPRFIKSWATQAEFPPQLRLSLDDIIARQTGIEFRAVRTTGRVVRNYGPNAAMMTSETHAPVLVLWVGRARDAMDHSTPTLGDWLEVDVVVRDAVRPDFDRDLFPAVPPKDLARMAGNPALEAYEVRPPPRTARL